MVSSSFVFILLIGFLYEAVATNDQCPGHLPKNDHLVQYIANCYEFILDHPGNWHVANSNCKAKGGDLVDINSFPEQGFVYNTLKLLGQDIQDKGVWIGLTDDNSDKTWSWTSGKPLGFFNWADDQPGIVSYFEDCVLMEIGDGKWHDYSCDGFLFTSENHGWICKYGLGN